MLAACRPIGHVAAFGPSNGCVRRASKKSFRVRDSKLGPPHACGLAVIGLSQAATLPQLGVALPAIYDDRRFGAWRAASIDNNASINCSLQKVAPCFMFQAAHLCLCESI